MQKKFWKLSWQIREAKFEAVSSWHVATYNIKNATTCRVKVWNMFSVGGLQINRTQLSCFLLSIWTLIFWNYFIERSRIWHIVFVFKTRFIQSFRIQSKSDWLVLFNCYHDWENEVLIGTYSKFFYVKTIFVIQFYLAAGDEMGL